MRKQWFNDGKNCETLKDRELVDLPLAQPDRMMWVRAILALVVDLNFNPPSWHRWIKLLDATVNWSLSAITFSMSLPRVFRRTIGWKAFGWSYDDLFDLGMTIVVDTLKYLGQWPNLMQELAMLMILERQSSFAIMIFKWHHVNLSGPSEDESLHLLIADLNSYWENGFHPWVGLYATLLRKLKST